MAETMTIEEVHDPTQDRITALSERFEALYGEAIEKWSVPIHAICTRIYFVMPENYSMACWVADHTGAGVGKR